METFCKGESARLHYTFGHSWKKKNLESTGITTRELKGFIKG